MFLKAVWHKDKKAFLIYKIGFILIAFLFEIAQISGKVAGTFDIFDLLTMGSIALLESIAHKFQPTRREL